MNLITVTYNADTHQLVPKKLPEKYNDPMRAKLIDLCYLVSAGKVMLYDDFWLELISSAPNPPELSASAAPIEKQKRLIGWRTGDFLYETNDRELALNWLGNVEVLPVFEGDINTTLTSPPKPEQGK